MSQRSRLGLLLIVMIGVAVGLRLYGLGDIPYGMDHDEGHNGIDAVQIMAGWRPVFLPRNNGREPLFMYLMAGVLTLFGPTFWAMRLTGVLASLLMLPAQYLLVSRLPLPRPRLTALLSMALVAVTFWTISKGHQALRAGLLPVWIALLLWAWWLALRDVTTNENIRPAWRGWLWSGLAGLFLSAAVYTHLTGRVLPSILIISGAWLAWRVRTWRPLLYAGLALAVAGLLAVPQALFFVERPDLLGHRVEQVSIFSPAINDGRLGARLVDNAVSLALMFNVRGDRSWSENVPGRPVFDPLVGLAFLLGLGLLGRDLVGRRGLANQTAALMSLMTLGVMLTPSWLSESAPHYGRLTGVWPVMFLLPAWGLERVAAWVDGWRGRPAQLYGRSVGLVFVGLVMAISGVWAARDYFVVYAEGQRVAETFRRVNVERAQAIAGLIEEGATYLTPAAWNQSVTRFLTITNPPRSFDPRQGLVLPGVGDARYVFEPGEREAADEFAKRWPQVPRQDVVDETGALVLIAFHLTQAHWPRLESLASDQQVVFGEHVRLVGYATRPSGVTRGQRLTVMLDWEALAPTAIDHNFFVHVVAGEGRGIGQFDGPPLGGSYPTTVWVAGERVYQTVTLGIAPDAPLGPARLRVGWYDWRTGQRLPLANDEDAALDIGQIEIKS